MQAWGSGIQHFGMYQVTMGLDILELPKHTINPSCNAMHTEQLN